MPYIVNPKLYFLYILVSTTCRNFEAGLVAAMMRDIKADLHMSYTLEARRPLSLVKREPLSTSAAALWLWRCLCWKRGSPPWR